MSIHIFVVRERGGKNHPSGTTVQAHQKDQRSHTYRFNGKRSLDIRRSHQSCIKLRQKKTGRWGRSNKTCSTKRSEVMGPMPSKTASIASSPVSSIMILFNLSSLPGVLGFGMQECLTYTAKICTNLWNKKFAAGPQSPKAKGENSQPTHPSVHRSIAGGLLSPASSSASVKAGSPGARLLFTCSWRSRPLWHEIAPQRKETNDETSYVRFRNI